MTSARRPPILTLSEIRCRPDYDDYNGDGGGDCDDDDILHEMNNVEDL